MTTQVRAPKGGTIGINGLSYKGGSFLPTTTLGKISKAKPQSGNRTRTILTPVRALCGLTFDETVATVTANDQAIAYYGHTRQQVESIVERYNKGER